MENRTISMYNGMVYGEKVSEYGLMKGKLDYHTLRKIVEPCVFNGIVRERTPEEWDIFCGYLDDDEEVMSDYIISQRSAEFLKENTDELVFYNSHLNMHIWGVKHWGTAWDYVTTNIELVEEV